MARWLVVIMTLALGACGGKKDEAPAGGSPAAPNQPVTPKPSSPLKTTPATADFAMLPNGSELVLGANVAQLVKSEVYKALLEPRLAQTALMTKLAELKTRCGIDPLASIQRVSAGVKGFGGGAKPEGVVVVHGLDKERTLACVEAEAKAKAEVTRDGDATIVKTARGDTIAFQFTTASDAIVVFGPNANAAAIKAAASGTSTLAKAQQFVDLFNQIETEQTAWVVMNGNSKAFALLESLGMQAKALYGSANATDGVTIDLRLKLASGDQAMRLASLASQQTKGLSNTLPFNKLDVTADGEDVKVAFAVDAATMPAFVKRLQGLLEGRMGTGMGRP